MRRYITLRLGKDSTSFALKDFDFAHPSDRFRYTGIEATQVGTSRSFAKDTGREILVEAARRVQVPAVADQKPKA